MGKWVVSAAIIKNSIPRQAVRKALSDDIVIRSLSTTIELSRILKRDKFDRYFKDTYERDAFIYLHCKAAKLVKVFHKISVCRDPSDDKYLELAIAGNAIHIITGDPDLIALDSISQH